MDIIYKSKTKIKDAKALLFGLKDFSLYSNVISLEEVSSYSCLVFLSIDKNIFEDDLSYLTDILSRVDNYDIAGIMFYDLSVLSIAKRLGIKTPLIWNQDFLVTNYKTCNYYENEGVSGAVISPVITISDIVTICENTNFDVIVPVFGYQKMAVSKRNLVSNYFQYIGEENALDLNYMIERDSVSPIVETSYGTVMYTKDVLNAVRYIFELKNAGVKYVILDDMFLSSSLFSKVSDIYERAVLCENEDELLVLEDEVKSLISNTSLMFFDKKTVYRVKKND